jgi:hypothetical protein
MSSKSDLQKLQSDRNFKCIWRDEDSYMKMHAIGTVYVGIICGLCCTKWQPWILMLTLYSIGKLCNTTFTRDIFVLFFPQFSHQKRQGFKNYPRNFWKAWYRPDILTRTADEPSLKNSGISKNTGVWSMSRICRKCTFLITFLLHGSEKQ